MADDDQYDDEEQMPDLGGGEDAAGDAGEEGAGNGEDFGDADALMDEELMAAFGDQTDIPDEQEADLGGLADDSAMYQLGDGTGEAEALEGQEEEVAAPTG